MSRSELEHEQSYVDRLYARLDELRARTGQELAAVRRAGPSGTPQNRSERDAFATLHEDRLAQLEAVEDRLAFGRLDLVGDGHRYIGRLGLSDEHQSQLLVDWRAPAARSFYQATAAQPGDVVRRRHLATRGRRVVGVEDEVLDLAALDHDDRRSLNGEGALLAAIGAHRTGRMGDIVATIQAEQDRVIRADLAGVLVVQGGPGTGKTAVALHRAAYLLYTHRDRLRRSGVLLVGPNTLFLRYIEAVLPSLGETGVVMSTPGTLFPGVEATGEDPPDVAVLKGDPRMARVVAAAVHARQRVPETTRRLQVDRVDLALTPAMVSAARSRARRGRKPHNLARAGFLLDLLDQLAAQLAEALGTGLDAGTRAELLADLRDAPDVRRELNLAWMPVTPQRLVSDLLADDAALQAAAPHLSAAERALLRREPGAAWTISDVPLLDEAAELLGDDDTAARLAAAARAAELASEQAYARDVLSVTGSGAGIVSAQQLADRYVEGGPALTVAERAEADRTWAYGHVVVDEAQELSPMMWRLLMRRCPSRSMTLVGDTAQTGSAAGAGSWGAVLDPFVEGRWRQEALTVNYRTPAQIMALATAVLTAAGVEAAPLESVRDGDVPPRHRRLTAGSRERDDVDRDDVDRDDVDRDDVDRDDVDRDGVVLAVREELAAVGTGRLAVIAPERLLPGVRSALVEELPPGTVGTGRDALDSPVAVLGVTEAKGLEFDGVVLLEPADVLGGSKRGVNDLYVALTRPTQRLLVLHAGELPPGFAALG